MKTGRINLRVAEALKRKLGILAKRYDMPLAAMCETILMQYEDNSVIDPQATFRCPICDKLKAHRLGVKSKHLGVLYRVCTKCKGKK